MFRTKIQLLLQLVCALLLVLCVVSLFYGKVLTELWMVDGMARMPEGGGGGGDSVP